VTASSSRWCDWVKARVSQPVSLVPGNHEAQDGDGVFGKFANCLPDRLGVQGDYATGHYYLDDGPVRVIMTSPGITLPTGTRTYGKGTVEREQVKDWIDEAKAAGSVGHRRDAHAVPHQRRARLLVRPHVHRHAAG
jgi:hypothetical protein